MKSAIQKGWYTMKKQTMVFRSWDEYESWTEQFENCSDSQDFPVLIDYGCKIATDMFTECKSWKTALRRFEKAFAFMNEVSEWVPFMRESCEGGLFKDHLRSSNVKHGYFSWGVEETSDGCWYIFLNLTGIYAGREPEMA